MVAYTGNPIPATLARLSSQFENAKSEWNEGARTVWSIAAESSRPTV
jgi:hypothetical protein